MQLVERHVIKRADPRFASLDPAAFASKNLYNAANYVVRQAFIGEGVWLDCHELDRRMQGHEAYQALPAKVAQWVLRLLDQNWQNCFAARSAWQADPSRFLGCPRLSGYKDTVKGRNLLVYTAQALSAPALRRGRIVPSRLNITVRRQQQRVQQVGIIPGGGFYVVDSISEREPVPEAVNPALRAGCDSGLNNLATLASDKPGFVPAIVNRRPVETINQHYNKRRVELQSHLGEDTYMSRRLERLITGRARRIDHYPHTASRRLIDRLMAEGIGMLVIGKNPLWKREVLPGRRTNQSVVSVPMRASLSCLPTRRRWWVSRSSLPRRVTPARPAFSTLIRCQSMRQRGPRRPSVAGP